MKKVLLLIFFTLGLAWVIFLTMTVPRRHLPEGSQWHISEGGIALFNTSGINDIQYSSDGTRIAVASSVGLWLYDVGTDKPPVPLTTDTRIISVSFSPDGKMLASGCGDGVVRLWDVDTGMTKVSFIAEHGKWRTPLETILTNETTNAMLTRETDFFDILFSSDGETLVSWCRHEGNLWDVATRTHKKTLQGLPISARSVISAQRGSTISINADGMTLGVPWGASVHLFDIRAGEITQTQTFKGHINHVRSTAISPDGKTLASGGLEDTVRLWDIETGRQMHLLKRHQRSVFHVVFSPDGKTLASAGWDDTIHLWNADTGKHKKTLIGHLDAIQGVTFSPDGQTIVTWSNDRTVRLWDVDTGRYKKTLPFPKTSQL